MESNPLKHWQYVLLILIILASGFLVYKIHYSFTGRYFDPYSANIQVEGKNIYYPYPYHADEWTHMASGIYLVEEGKIPKINPYSGWKHTDLEPGFHVFLGLLFMIMDPVKSYQFFPAFNAMLLSLAIFFFVYVLTKKYYAGLLSAIFAASIQSNINIQGSWFFLPFTFGLSLMFLTLALYFSKRYIIAGILLLMTATVYPIAAIIAFGTGLLYEFLQGRLKKYWHYGLGTLAIIFSLIILFRKKIPLINFEYGWTPVFEHTYVPWDIYGWVGIIFAVIGLAFVIFRKEYKNKIISPMYIMLITIIPMLMYMLFRFSIIIPYQRSFVYFMYGFAIFSGLGLYYSCLYLSHLLKHLRWNKYLSMGIVGLIVLLSVVTSFIGYYTIKDDRFLLTHYVTDEDYNALMWINQNYGVTDLHTIMMSDMFAAYSVYPIARIKTVAVPASNLQTGNIQRVYDFYYLSKDCYTKIQSMRQGKATLAYSAYPINCQELKEVYNKGRYIYALI